MTKPDAHATRHLGDLAATAPGERNFLHEAADALDESPFESFDDAESAFAVGDFEGTASVKLDDAWDHPDDNFAAVAEAISEGWGWGSGRITRRDDLYIASTSDGSTIPFVIVREHGTVEVVRVCDIAEIDGTCTAPATESTSGRYTYTPGYDGATPTFRYVNYTCAAHDPKEA